MATKFALNVTAWEGGGDSRSAKHPSKWTLIILNDDSDYFFDY